MRKSILRTILIAASVAVNPAHAYFTCTGTVQRLSVAPNGRVMLSIGFGSWWMCGLSTAEYGVTTEACRAWYAAFLAAQKADHTIRFYFDPTYTPNANNVPECSSVGDWASPSPRPYHMDIHGS